MPGVNLVVTCTKRKTRTPIPGLRLGEVAAESAEARAELWAERLRTATGDRIPAFDLYAGDHWSVVRSIPRTGARSGHEVKLWICSAGYGLISAEAEVHPYSATFSSRHADQVHRFTGVSRRESHRRWWAALQGWEGPHAGEPRTIRDLAQRAPDVPIVVVGSDSYLDPLAADLRSAVEVLASPDLLIMLSGGTGHSAGLERNLVPFDARLNRVLHGPLMSLNARVAREILARRVGLSVPAVTGWITEFGRELPRFAYPVRGRITDAEVTAFIRRELDDNSRVRWSPLHRKLRDELGLACEQKRFRDLFFTVVRRAGAQEGPRL